MTTRQEWKDWTEAIERPERERLAREAAAVYQVNMWQSLRNMSAAQNNKLMGSYAAWQFECQCFVCNTNRYSGSCFGGLLGGIFG